MTGQKFNAFLFILHLRQVTAGRPSQAAGDKRSFWKVISIVLSMSVLLRLNELAVKKDFHRAER